MDDLIALFAEWRADIDDVPFAHELLWVQWSGDRLQEVPRD
jgi:hypothetical protein